MPDFYDEVVNFQTIRLDDCMEQFTIFDDKPIYLKVEAEGTGLEVFSGSRSFLINNNVGAIVRGCPKRKERAANKDFGELFNEIGYAREYSRDGHQVLRFSLGQSSKITLMNECSEKNHNLK